MNILEAVRDSNLFAPWFRGNSWSGWFAFLAGLFGLPMTKKQAALYSRFANRSKLPRKPAKEAWMVMAGGAEKAS